MPANLDKTQDRKASAGRARCARLNVVAGTPQPEDQAVFTSSDLAKPTFPAATQLDLSTIEGTVGASMTAVEEQSYGSGSGALLSGAPLPRAPQREAAVAPALRANLIAELREISGQVNRMMAQVDRAIHRLGEHAGEPVRR